MTYGQIESWYHSKILRISHGKQNPKKKYLTEKQILELFNGNVVIQEKIDGKIRVIKNTETEYWICEDVSGKHTVHNHVIEYKNPPSDKLVYLDSVWEVGDTYYIPKTSFHRTTYAELYLFNCNLGLKEIYTILSILSDLPSHFGSKKTEGLVVKNYERQLFGKWINEEFEEKIVQGEANKVEE